MEFKKFVLSNSLVPDITLVEISKTPVLSFTNAQVVGLKAQLALRHYQITESLTAPTNTTQTEDLEKGRQALINVFVAYQDAMRVSKTVEDLKKRASDPTKVDTTTVTAAINAITHETTGACVNLFNSAEKNVKTPASPATDIKSLTETLQTKINEMGKALEAFAVKYSKTNNWSVIESKFALT